MSNGRANFAFSGNRNEIWHSLGSAMTPGASIEDWVTEAGLNWQVNESPVLLNTTAGQVEFPNKKALYRSDTNQPLAVVSKDYKVVQPTQVIEFFRDLTSIHGMELSAAGSLFGGRRFWATASTGKTTQAFKGDTTEGFLLLVTSVDSTIATIAKMTSVRTVCNNTLTTALVGGTKNMVRKTHASTWDPESVKLDMGLVDVSWDKFSQKLKRLAETEVSDKCAMKYLQDKFYVADTPIENQPRAAVKQVNQLFDLYRNGTGANYSTGTAYGILQAVTDKFSHGTGKRDPSLQMWDCHFGKLDNIKTDVFNELCYMFA